MFATSLAIILGLLIIYIIFTKNEQKEPLTQRTLPVAISPVVAQKPLPVPTSLPSIPSLEDTSLAIDGANITIYNTSDSKCKKCPYQGPPWRRRRYYSEFKEIYSPKARRLPGEDIRFDLLTPIPYSDAFVAPMGKSYNAPPIASTLAQITYPHQKGEYETTFS